jgi:hypothetical protein
VKPRKNPLEKPPAKLDLLAFMTKYREELRKGEEESGGESPRKVLKTSN